MVISDNVIIQLKNIPPAELEACGVIVPARTKANGYLTYICPNCGNGNGDSGDGIAFEYKDGAWLAKCFKCGEGYDNLKLLALHYGLNIQTDFKEICNRAAADFSIATDAAAPPKYAPKVEETALDDKELELIQADISNAAKNIEFLPLDCRRGLSIDTLKKFNCGFIENWKSPKSRVADTFATPTPRLIVPSGNHYLARLTVPVETFPADVQKYIRPKQHAGKKSLFGAITITNKTEIIYVFEGEIDAMSAWQAYETDFNIASICAFVATCGAAEQKWLAEVDNICKGFNIKPRFKIFFDNDDAGKDWTIKHRAELLKRGYLAISKTFADYDKDKIDANNILQEHGKEILVNKLFYADDSDLFAAAQNEIDELERKLLAEKAAKEKIPPFIKDTEKAAEFEKLIKLPPSDDRNKKLSEIILANLQYKLNKAGNKISLLCSAINFERILAYDPVISDLFAFEEFSEKIVLINQPFWAKSPRVNTELKGEDDAQLRTYIRKTYNDLNSQETFADVTTVIAQKKSFHVVKNYFDSLPRWDKKPRAETLFIDFLKVEDTPFARAVTMKWLLAAVCRIFYPGCNFQAALVLQGNQNIGKSYILEKLGGAWYGCLIENVEKVDSARALRNFWICEIKELAAARRAEINAVKSFIERSADTYREPYARRPQTFSRHCAFAITCNDRQFLRDQTGNRRYLILESPLAEFEYIEKLPSGESLSDEYIQQIWAEVYFQFKQLTANGFNDKILELPKEFKIQAEKIASTFTVNDGLKAEIAAFLDIPILPPTVWNILTIPERKKFFAEGNNIVISSEVIQQRKENLSAKKAAELENYIDSKYVTELSNDYLKILQYQFFGNYIRQETCASEILNELPTGNDKRKNINRINEVLGSLDGWQKLDKARKNFKGYGHQVNCYYRVNFAESDSDDD